MTDDTPISCSLGASDLQRRVAAIAAIGVESLTARGVADGVHLLRFRADAATRARLAQIVAAEAECCPFLQLALRDEADELVLSIASSDDAQSVADELAAAFGESTQ